MENLYELYNKKHENLLCMHDKLLSLKKSAKRALFIIQETGEECTGIEGIVSEVGKEFVTIAKGNIPAIALEAPHLKPAKFTFWIGRLVVIEE
jgi:hypothetical protein